MAAKQPLCAATTAAGKPCTQRAVEGATLCVSHLRMTGPKTTLTPELTERIAVLVSAGNHVSTAIAVAGVSRSTFRRWWTRGDPAEAEPRDEGFRAFRRRIDEAKQRGEASLVNVISLAARNDPKWAAWMLERAYSDRWARPSQRADEPEDVPKVGEEYDPFSEVDELAEQRKRRSGS